MLVKYTLKSIFYIYKSANVLKHYSYTALVSSTFALLFVCFFFFFTAFFFLEVISSCQLFYFILFLYIKLLVNTINCHNIFTIVVMLIPYRLK